MSQAESNAPIQVGAFPLGRSHLDSLSEQTWVGTVDSRLGPLEEAYPAQPNPTVCWRTTFELLPRTGVGFPLEGECQAFPVVLSTNC